MVVCKAAFRIAVNLRFLSSVRPGIVKINILPVVMKIQSQEFRNLFTPELTKLSEIFKTRNFDLRIAGGAVRDLLMGIAPADVDFATTATPDEMKQLFESEGIRMLHKRGEEHGTITCRMNDAENFEITTLRVDKVCNGRRAEVEYTRDWQLDANRRDLTINSLFLDLDGNVIDYFGGIEDAKKRRVTFVGDPAQRIQEDYLRILRYFRFFGRISDSSVHEQTTIDAIIAHKSGLKSISPERIWTEMKKIVVGRMAPEIIKCMLLECDLADYIGLPRCSNLDRFNDVYRNSPNVEPMTMVATLCTSIEDVAKFHQKTKLSNAERLLGEFIVSQREEGVVHALDVSWWRSLIVDTEIKPGHGTVAKDGRQRVEQLAYSCGLDSSYVSSLRDWQLPIFDVNGKILMEHGVKNGPMMRNTLLYLYGLWKENDYNIDKEQLLKHAFDDCIPKVTPPSNRKRKQTKDDG